MPSCQIFDSKWQKNANKVSHQSFFLFSYKNAPYIAFSVLFHCSLYREYINYFGYRCHIRQVVQILHQIDPKHPFQIVGLISALSFVVVRSDQADSFGRSLLKILVSLSAPVSAHRSGPTDSFVCSWLYYSTFATGLHYAVVP